MYFSEFAHLLVCGFTTYTCLYNEESRYKISIVAFENVSNTFNTKFPLLDCIASAYTTWARINFVAVNS